MITRVVIVTPRYDRECRELLQRSVIGSPTVDVTVDVIEDRRVGQRRKRSTMMAGRDRRKSDRRGHQKFSTGTLAVFHRTAPAMPTQDPGVINI